MCDPITLGLAAVSATAMLMGNSNDSPPQQAMPAPAAPVNVPAGGEVTARAPGADVRIGDGTKSAKASTTPQYDGFTEKRVTGKPLGGLGRGGLGL